MFCKTFPSSCLLFFLETHSPFHLLDTFSQQAPFVPRRSIKPLTTVDPNFVLHSEARASDREKFDDYLREKGGASETPGRETED